MTNNQQTTAHKRSSGAKPGGDRALAEANRQLYFLSSVLMQSPQPFVACDFSGRILMFNKGFSDLTGYPAEELKHTNYKQLVPESWRSSEAMKTGEVIKTGKSAVYECEYLRKDGSLASVELNVDRLNAQDGEAVCMFIFATDITEKKKLISQFEAARAQAEAAERRSTFLAEASNLLTLSLDYHSILQRFAEIAVPNLADFCIVWILNDDGAVKPLAITHANPDEMKHAREVIERFPPSEERNQGVVRVIRTGQPIYMKEINEQVLLQVAQNAEHLEILRKANFTSYIGVPLAARNKIFGAMSFFMAESKRTYSPEDLALAEELASRAAIVIDNALLFRSLRASLQEKELLLQELHHRVKNNLQVISSLLSLQAAKFENRELLAVFEDSRNRVRTMALIHEKLYGSGDLARINFGEYLQSLSESLSQSYYMDPSRKIGFKVNAGEYRLDINKAVPLGLIANELISNAFKYAFPGGNGEVLIDLELNGKSTAVLIISDNGIGLPRNVNLKDPASLGLKLVNLLVRQIDGNVEILDTGSGTGTTYKISFPTGSVHASS